MSWVTIPGTGDMDITSQNTFLGGKVLVTDAIGVGSGSATFPASIDGILMQEVAAAPSSGDLTIGGVLYVLSGGLHFMGNAGTVTVVASP